MFGVPCRAFDPCDVRPCSCAVPVATCSVPMFNVLFAGCAECLVQWRGDPDSLAGRRLDRLYFEALQMWTAVQVGYPDRVKVRRYFTIS
jgi:hypothetical protein